MALTMPSVLIGSAYPSRPTNECVMGKPRGVRSVAGRGVSGINGYTTQTPFSSDPLQEGWHWVGWAGVFMVLGEDAVVFFDW